MSVESQHSATEAAILGRVIEAQNASLAPEAARALLELGFHSADQQRMEALAAKAAEGPLTAQERIEAESYNYVGHILALLQSKARLSLKKAGLDT